MRRLTLLTIAFAISALTACDGDSPEELACANLFTIDPIGGCASGSETECLSYLDTLRDDAPACGAEYDAYVQCLTDQTECASGQQCPTEFTAYIDCATD
ncbi:MULTISPECIES: hypothetical protein [Sandaracinus]|uniref:hypothetical protein n=1 Tax=Sandaracinus TaxID=1055688 RepID=UPI0019D470FF|nr:MULTISPECIES: hypothetical protein [Sandaracinus]QRN75767.1 Hypothetical protein MSR10575_88540 [Sandaracinus sp.]UJR87271.1 Hypothetical protein I5071_630 [Sandaracinus amylolyticus]